jgi:tetratricopeptide (TPR) repeat protein
MGDRRVVGALCLIAVLAGVTAAAFRTNSVRAAAEKVPSALMALDRGDAAPAEQALASLKGRQGFEHEANLLEAALLLSRQKPNEALAALAKIDPNGPLRRQTLLCAVRALYAQNQLLEAEAILRTLVTENPEDADAHRWLAAIYYDIGAFDASKRLLEKVISLAPDDYRPHRLLGLMNRDFEDYKEAVTEYERALRLSPPATDRNEMMVEMARARIALLQYEGALHHLKLVHPNASTHALAAQCHIAAGRIPEAKEELALSTGIDPNERLALMLEADVLSLEKKDEEALAVLRRAVSAHPHDAECRYRLALLLQRLGRKAESEAEMARWQETRNLMTRLTDLNTEAVRDPANAKLREDLAVVCAALGKRELSEMWKRAAAACRAAAGAAASNSAAPANSAAPTGESKATAEPQPTGEPKPTGAP